MSVKSLLTTASAVLALSFAIPVSALAQEDAAEAFQSLMDDHWSWVLEQNPVFATSVGVRDYDDRLGSVSIENAALQDAKSVEFLERLDAIDADALSAADRINYDLLRLDLQNDIEAEPFGMEYILMTNRAGPHTNLARLPDQLPFFTKADYESYVARLGDIPRYLSEAEETLRAGAAAGWTQPCAPMQGVEDAIRFHAVDSADDSVFMKPFAEKPATISSRDWRRLSRQAERAVERSVLPAFAQYAGFYAEEYAPVCREDLGASGYPNGDEFYAYRARFFTTTDMTVDEIHELGISEVARIRAEMMDVIEEVEFEGDFKAFQEFLRTDPQFYAETPEELVAAVAVIAKKQTAPCRWCSLRCRACRIRCCPCRPTSLKERQRPIMSVRPATVRARVFTASTPRSSINARCLS